MMAICSLLSNRYSPHALKSLPTCCCPCYLACLHCGYMQAVKSQLEVTTKKLKQSKEEGEQIRADLKQMIQQYQVTEIRIALSILLSSY